MSNKYLHYPPNSYNNIFCDHDVEYPIEHLWKSIFMLQYVTELDKETERLKKKLHKYLIKATKEEKGSRSYEGAIHYYPTGLCVWNGQNIILEGYVSTYAPPEPKPVVVEKKPEKKPRKASTRRYPSENVLTKGQYYQSSYKVWYAQVKEYQKRKKYTVPSFNFTESAKKQEIYAGLNEQERKMIDQSHGFRQQFADVAERIFNVFMSHFEDSQLIDHHNFKGLGDHYTYKKGAVPQSKFFFLMDDEIEELIALCENARNAYLNKKDTHWYQDTHSYFEPEMLKFVKSLDINREGRIVIDLTDALVENTVYYHERRWFSMETTDEHGNPVYGGEYRRVENVRTDLEATNLYPVFLRETAKIKDETIIRILTNMNLYHPDLFPEEVEEEEVIIEPESELIIMEVGEKKSLKEKMAKSKVIEAEIVE